MLWSDASDLTSIWSPNVEYAIAKSGTDALLAFNEPDGCWEGQSCMNVSRSAASYKTWIQPFAGRVRLGAPAVTNAEADGVGLDWLAQFMAACEGCTVDFIPLHFYGSVLDRAALGRFVEKAHDRFGLPVWVTEFGPEGGNADMALGWLRSVLGWLDGQTYVERYAYFMDRAGEPYLINANGTGMSPIGKVYNSG